MATISKSISFIEQIRSHSRGRVHLGFSVERDLEALQVGDSVLCEPGEAWFDPHGNPLAIEASQEEDTQRVRFQEPGLYRVLREDVARSVAVNLSLDESDTRVMDLQRLERLGVATSESRPTEVAIERKERLRGAELESEQRIWRWLIVGMLAAIAIETLLSARSTPSASGI